MFFAPLFVSALITLWELGSGAFEVDCNAIFWTPSGPCIASLSKGTSLAEERPSAGAELAFSAFTTMSISTGVAVAAT
jgi:hypothetical protein